MIEISYRVEKYIPINNVKKKSAVLSPYNEK